ncbi:phasin family protein [Massilia sp. GCM10020059]|uniref:Phasin family protein n=1 Tax=Massilia agrisoli TaxID=2892444 RepID=A0ABS8IR72_9BURK|nr:phasin family protein [Massilia agrisoli]MCC6071122.1 phasin family protein [Massilia agrisoli]
MSTLPEQFSAASKSQIHAQLDFLESFGARAFDGAARLIALNIDTSRAAVDSSSAALKQLATLRDPRDLLALAKGPQDFSKMVAYGSQWLSIMADVQAGLFKAAAPSPLAFAPQAAPAPGVAAQAPVAEPAAAPAEGIEEHARSVKPSKKPVVAARPEAASGPAAEEKPIAKAAGKVAGKPLDIKPAAAPLDTDGAHVLPQVKPVEASPPPTVFEQNLLTPKRGKKR